MRETSSLAEAYGRQELPASLMQRLAYMEQVARAASAQAAGYARMQLPAPPRPRGPSRGAQAVVLAWFSLGVLTSGAIGTGALVGLRALESGWSPTPLATAWATTPLVATAPQPKAAWETVQVEIARSEPGRAPLPLQVAAADDTPIAVVVQGLPAGVRLSRGEPLGWSGWVLKQADLDGLHLTLDDGAPDTFELKITALATPGTPTVGSIVQVRLLDRADPKHAAPKGGVQTAPPRAPVYAGLSDGPATGMAGAAGPAGTPDKSAAPVAEPAQRPAAAPTAVNPKGLGQQLAAAGPWPEVASGLGAVARAPEGAIGRQMWWQMPPLSRSP
jgi:hypothetical protein